MLGFDDLNNAAMRLGAGLGNVAGEFDKAQTAQREKYMAQAKAASNSGAPLQEVVRLLKLADPTSTAGDHLQHKWGQQATPNPGAVNPAGGLPTTPTPGAPAPALKAAPVPSWNNPMGGTAADLPTSMAPGIGQAPAPADLATQATDAFAPQPKWMGVNPRRVGLGAGDGVDETTTTWTDLGVDWKSPDNAKAIAAALGIQKPEAKAVNVDGYGLVEYTPGYAGLPSETKTVLAEKLGAKDAAALALDKDKANLHAKLTREGYANQVAMNNMDNGIRAWIAGIGDATDRWKADLAAKAKGAGLSDDQAKAIAAVGNMVRGLYPRKKDMTGEFTETDDEYEARVSPMMKAYLGVAGITLPDIPVDTPKPAPAGAPQPPAPPAPAGGSIWDSLPSMPSLPGAGARSGAAAPGGGTPPPAIPPTPKPPMPNTQSSTAWSQKAVANGKVVADAVAAKFPWAKVGRVDPTTGDVLVNYDAKLFGARERRMIEDLDSNVVVVDEVPGKTLRLQVIGTPKGAAKAPTAKPTPNGATDRATRWLDQNKPKE